MRATLQRWQEAFAAYAHPRVRAMLFLGYSSGLPFTLVLMTLAARLRQSGIDRSTIGYFAWVGFAYSLKFFWSPVVDRLQLPVMGRLGRRRSWMLLSQCGVIGGLLLMGFADPGVDPVHMALLAVGTAFFAATQDIAVDAWRIEAVGNELQASMAAAYQMGYQVALICSQAGMFWFVSLQGWTAGYILMAALMIVGVGTTLLIAEPEVHVDRATLAREQRVVDFLEDSAHWPESLRQATAWLIGAVVCPFMDFFARNGWRAALPVLLLIVTYRLNYMTMGVMANPFYLDMGFTLDQIAEVAKLYGVIMSLVGALMGGVLVARYGIPRMLLAGLLLLTAANLAYAYIAGIGPGLGAFAVVISLDNFGNGLAGAVFIAYMSSLTNTAYTATQYALFGTLWSFPAKGLAGFSGKIVDALGYRGFFIYSALVGMPALLLVLWLIRRPAAEPPAPATPA
ncbi:MAG TPA: MFS transporter [Gammaproteobacteria bacterium]|nr:MFS transporter [Gammaproteobacteria bacterium]